MSHLVFSDESGRWSDPSCDIYVRSFIVFDSDEYDKLSGNIYRNYGPLVLKWTNSGNIRQDPELCRLLFSKCRVFIAFTDLQQFRNKDYRVKRAVEDLDYSALVRDFQNQFDLKGDLLNKLNQLLFLNVYERQFFERFNASASVNISEYRPGNLFIDNPQQNNDDFEVVIKMVCNPKPEKTTIVRNDADHLGVGIADFAAGVFSDILNGRSRRNAADFYVEYIAPSNILGNSANPNPSYQFYPDGQQIFKDRMSTIWRRVNS